MEGMWAQHVTASTDNAVLGTLVTRKRGERGTIHMHLSAGIEPCPRPTYTIGDCFSHYSPFILLLFVARQLPSFLKVLLFLERKKKNRTFVQSLSL